MALHSDKSLAELIWTETGWQIHSKIINQTKVRYIRLKDTNITHELQTIKTLFEGECTRRRRILQTNFEKKNLPGQKKKDKKRGYYVNHIKKSINIKTFSLGQAVTHLTAFWTQPK